MPRPRLLLTGDDAALHSLLDTALGAAGYEVVHAMAHDYLFMAQETEPSIVIVACGDRRSCAGAWECGALLRQHAPERILILLSTDTALVDEVSARPREHGFDAALQMPFTVDQLLAVVGEHALPTR